MVNDIEQILELFDSGYTSCEISKLAMQEIADLVCENIIMYGAIFEDASMGSARCKCELQRIAKKDVEKPQ